MYIKFKSDRILGLQIITELDIGRNYGLWRGEEGAAG